MKAAIAAAFSLAAFTCAFPAGADDRLVAFQGGIGAQVWARNNANGAVIPNDVSGVQPGGRPWVIQDLRADIRTNGSIKVDGRGLLLGGGGVGTTGGQSVHARLFCGGVAHNSGTVPLEPNGDFRIDGVLTPVPATDTCASPILLIVSGVAPAGSWFAAGIPK